ncbi:hypothetical protein [Neobacillus massiliamazoniensis]|uniref:hypothetical protein n=1 Tax=Neobacillus massiliamazoniensis TaxID=1499688 RepID=UPI000B8226CE|nr:hypothetical protein [Neobacillus massiliamazoniensis]
MIIRLQFFVTIEHLTQADMIAANPGPDFWKKYIFGIITGNMTTNFGLAILVTGMATTGRNLT